MLNHYKIINIDNVQYLMLKSINEIGELKMSDRTVAIEGWQQLEWLMSDRWDMTLQEALQCMVDNNQDMSFLNDIKGLWVLKTKKGKEDE